MRRFIFLPFLLAACTGGDSSSSDTSKTGDSGTDTPAPECNTENEDCTAGTCRGEGGNMLPGSNCLECHKSGGGEAPPWTVGGTIYTDAYGTEGLSGATITVTDSTGKEVVLNSNSVGNFYSSEALTPPLMAKVEVDGETREMGSSVSTGACSTCHSCDGTNHAKLY